MTEFWRYVKDKFDELDAEKKQIQEKIQEKAKKGFGDFLDGVSDTNPLLKKIIDKSRTKWKV